jgi:hypothetical protein
MTNVRQFKASFSDDARADTVLMFAGISVAALARLTAAESINIDDQGVIRWTAGHDEVALFGANYPLAPACDYRAADYINSDRKKPVEKDLEHFARMGWDGMRLCFWGD